MKSFQLSRGCLLLLAAALFHEGVQAVRIPPGSFNATDTTITRRLRRLAVSMPASADDHLVENLPLLAPDEFPTKHWAGHLPASSEGDKFLFYWLFEPSESVAKEDAPLIIWLNGGPGCSSMDGLFLENGPFRLVQNDTTGEYEIKSAPHSWHKAPAYTLYIDQPVGTGLSFTTDAKKYPKTDEEVNVDFFFFLQSFFHLHADKFVQENAVHNPVYFSGESHAGHYIPHMMHYILQQNDLEDEQIIQIPLAGAAIGNGWIHPYYQYSAAKAAYGKALIDNAQMAAIARKEATCRELLESGQYSNGVCMRLLDDIVDNAYGKGSHYKVSMYDARKRESTHSKRDFPPGHKVVETYLGGHALSSGKMDPNLHKEVLKAIHAEAVDQDHKYKECTDPPYLALSWQDGKGVVDDVVAVLEHPSNVRLLFFNGVEDLICNHVGNEEVLENLPWTHQKEWTKATRFGWRANAEEDTVAVSGYMKEFENLMFLKVLSAGHMVPMDVPTTALEMMQTLMSKGSFASYEQGLDRAIPAAGSCAKDDEDST